MNEGKLPKTKQKNNNKIKKIPSPHSPKHKRLERLSLNSEMQALQGEAGHRTCVLADGQQRLLQHFLVWMAENARAELQGTSDNVPAPSR